MDRAGRLRELLGAFVAERERLDAERARLEWEIETLRGLLAPNDGATDAGADADPEADPNPDPEPDDGRPGPARPRAWPSDRVRRGPARRAPDAMRPSASPHFLRPRPAAELVEEVRAGLLDIERLVARGAR